jgi:MFS family permease
MLNICRGRPDLVLILLGRMVSTFGDGVALVALTLRLQGDGAPPYDVAMVLAAGSVPLLLLARPIGQLVDTHDSRRLLVTGGLLEVAATVPLIFLHSVAAIVALVAVLAGVSSLTGATWSALVPRVVGEDHVAEAVSAQTSLSVLALVAAPAVGGLLAGAFGTGVPIAIDAATFVVVTLAGLAVKTRRIADRGAASGPAAMRGGLTILRADRVLAPLLAGVALVVLLVGMVDVVTVYLVRDSMRASGLWYGVTEAAWMAGMVAGAVGAGLVRVEDRQIRGTIGGAALVPLAIAGGFGNGLAGVCMSTLLTTRTPDSARGRVSATTNAILGGAQGASLLAGGAAAVVLTPRQIYGAAGVLGLVAAGVVGIRSSRTVCQQPDRPSTVETAPSPS